MNTDRRYMSRKFALSAAAFLAGVGFFLAGKLDSAEWMTFTQWVLGLYLGANVADGAASRAKAP